MGKYEIACSILIIKALWIPHHIPNYKKRSKEIEKDLLSIHQTNFQVNHFTALLTWMLSPVSRGNCCGCYMKNPKKKLCCLDYLKLFSFLFYFFVIADITSSLYNLIQPAAIKPQMSDNLHFTIIIISSHILENPLAHAAQTAYWTDVIWMSSSQTAEGSADCEVMSVHGEAPC